MEGARMTDEWPLIERKIRSDDMVLRPTEKASEVVTEDVPDVLDELDLALDLDGGAEAPAAQQEAADAPGIRLGPEEMLVLQTVDGRRSVREICDLLPFGEFDTYRMLADMMTKQLVEQVAPERALYAAGPAAASRAGHVLAVVALALAVLGGLVTLPTHPLAPWTLLERAGATNQLRHYASMARLERLEKAVQVFYLDTGSFPHDTGALAAGGYVTPADLLDPWGRPYELRLSAGGYQLVGLDAEGDTTPSLTVSRRFNAIQSLVFAGASPEEQDGE
jgi:hypothetical protein